MIKKCRRFRVTLLVALKLIQSGEGIEELERIVNEVMRVSYADPAE